MSINYEILQKHKKWLEGTEGGERANLTGVDLTRANLFRANLNGADLTEAKLFRANLNGADLTEANLFRVNLTRADLTGACLAGANLTRADLTGANLAGSDLTGACLDGANLIGVRGNLKHIKSVFLETYPISYTSDILQIGCERHPITDWWDFDQEQIEGMYGKKYVIWWDKWKYQIKTLIEMSPAEPTGA